MLSFTDDRGTFKGEERTRKLNIEGQASTMPDFNEEELLKAITKMREEHPGERLWWRPNAVVVHPDGTWSFTEIAVGVDPPQEDQ